VTQVRPQLVALLLALLAAHFAAACGSGKLNGPDGGGGSAIGGFGAIGSGSGGAGGVDGITGSAGALGSGGIIIGGGGTIGSGAAGTAGGGAGLGGGAAGSAGAGGTAGTAPVCPGVSLQQDAVLDLDLRAVTVSGAVTLNGAPLPDEAASRGQIVFDDSAGQASLGFDLGATGARSYALRLPPGIYDVSYRGGGGACSTTSASAMPCGTGAIARGVVLTADAPLNLDIPVVTVIGKVTLDGARPPDLTRSRGSLTFRGSSDAAAAASTGAFPATGAITYRVNLMPGTYDVVYNGDPAGCMQAGAVPQIPCNFGVVRPRVPIAAGGTLDVDVPVVRLVGALPDATASRGALSFADASGVATSTASFGTSGPASYGVALIQGRYTISLAANAALCGPALTPQVPCLGGVLVDATTFTADGVLDVDIHAVTINGAVTLNGSPLPAASAPRGSLIFTRAAGGGGAYSMLGASGAGGYRVRLLAGTYDVDYAANPSLCDGTTAPPLPCTGGAIARGVDLSSDGVLDASLQRVTVTGRVTVRGAPMPAAAVNRGGLVLVRDDGAAVTGAPFGASGEATYAFALWPGAYEARLAANPALCAAGMPAPPVPCVGGTVRSAAAIQSDGVLDVDILPVVVSGAVTLNGGALPAEAADRGSIAFTRTAPEGAALASFSLGAGAPATYAMTVAAGDYLVSHAANSALCAPSRALPGVPCASQVIAGCDR
jgi:hypothetical protein